MRLIKGMSLRDGGTTSITISRGWLFGTSYTIDNSVPLDGRTRYIYKGKPFQKKEQNRLEINGEEELKLRKALEEILIDKYGKEEVENYLKEKIEVQSNSKWDFAIRFLYLMNKERC